MILLDPVQLEISYDANTAWLGSHGNSDAEKEYHKFPNPGIKS